jgi:hypothetical protein
VLFLDTIIIVDANRDLNITLGIKGLPVRIYIERLDSKVPGFLFFKNSFGHLPRLF